MKNRHGERLWGSAPGPHHEVARVGHVQIYVQGSSFMFRKISLIVAFLFAAFSLIASPTMAAVTFDATTGTGFVGKGDVQLALGISNADVQKLNDLSFASVSTAVTEVSWVCTNDRNENTQERARTTTTDVEGIVSATARVKNQITGYNLIGYSGTKTTSTSTEGPAVNSCPAGFWTLTTPAGDPVEISNSSTLTLNGIAVGVPAQ